MLILHAAASAASSLILWGEVPVSPASAAVPVAPRVARRVRASQCAISPYDAGVNQLSRALELAQFGAAHVMHEVELQLPSREDGIPCASSPLINDGMAAALDAGPQAWRVTAARIFHSSLLDRLLELHSAESNVLSHGIVAGDDLRFWAALTSFAAGLVVRQRFLPGLTQRQSGWCGIWEPIIAGDDLDRFNALARSAPGVCFAAPDFSVSDPGSVASAPIAVIHQFVSSLVDHMVRAGAPPAAPSTGYAQALLTTHDLWMRSLCSGTELTIGKPSEDIQQLQSELGRWKRRLNTTINAPFRLCFRLEEPPPLTEEELESASNVVAFRLSEDLAMDERPWHISYLLQSIADPSLYIDASAVWSDSHDSAVIASTAFSAREYLLSSLGAASMIYAPVEQSLLNARPSSVEIGVEESYRFLTEKAGLLQEAGFGVMLPPWWTNSNSRQRLKASARVAPSKMKSASAGLSMDSLVQFRWELALGDQQLSRQELEELAGLKVPLIRLRGQWVEVSPDQLQAAIKFLKSNKQSLALKDLLRMSIGAVELPEGMDFSGVTGDDRVAQILEQFQGEFKFEEQAAPSEFQGTLRPYQLRGYSWMKFLTQWGLGACLADDMGLGKTVQTLALIARNWELEPVEKRQPVLLICPMSVVGNWQREASRFTPHLPVMVHHGAGRKKSEMFVRDASKHAIVLSSYALLSKDQEFLSQIPWAGVIIDEAQSIKNSGTRQAQAARALPAQYKLALTGTPVENNVGDLWSIMEFLNPGMLGNQAQFKRKFLIPIQTESSAAATARLKTIVTPFILRRLKTDTNIIKDLPEKLEMKSFCNLTQEQASLYRAVLKEMELQITSSDGMGRKGLVLATMSKLKQICNHPAQFLHDSSSIGQERSGKLQRLASMLYETLAAGDASLIFTQFAEMGDILKMYLQDAFGEEVLFLHGGVTKDKRERMVERFQSSDGPRMFILSLKAGGVGLNLTRANQVFHFDRWWNPAVENQATDRAFRIGQSKNVQVHKFICLGTLEEKIDAMIEAKQELANSIVGTGEGWLTELSNEQLRELLALGSEAVSE